MTSTLDRNSSSSVALHLATSGYHVVPLVAGSKAARDKEWQNLRITPAQIPKFFDPKSDPGVGLLTGTEVSPGVYLVGIDIDVNDPDLIRNARLAFDGDPPAKFGQKGMTFLARMPAPAKKRIMRRKDPITKSTKQVVEILATGQQTVIPPTIHPETKKPYVWQGQSLLDCDPRDLPEFNDRVLFEIELAVSKPDSPVFLLNTMQWMGEKGGGDVHNSVVTAVASLVGHQWDEDSIWERIDRATRRAVLEYGDDYDWPTWEHEVRAMVRSAIDKGFANVTKKEKYHRIAAKWFIKTFVGDGKIYNYDGRVAMYKDGYFEIFGSDHVRHLIATRYEEPQGVSFLSNDWNIIVQTIIDIIPRFPRDQPLPRVCMRNGTFDMDDCEMRDHQPEDFLISNVDFDYDPEAVCPTYERVLNEIFEGNDDKDKCIATFEEFSALTLFEGTQYEKFLVLKGQPGSGKSTLIKLVQSIHGKNGVSAVPLHNFGDERYRATMVGKLLNVVNEVQATSYAVDNFLKAIVSGDAVQVRFLYQETFVTVIPARILVACNDMFRVHDTSGAVERRMLILPCDNTLDEKDQDKTLGRKLHAERAGVFNRMVAAWQRLRDRTYFDPPASHRAAVAEFTMDNNHVLQWFLSRTHQGEALANGTKPEKNTTSEGSSLYLDYAEWAKMNGFKQISSNTFSVKLSQMRFEGKAIDCKSDVKWIGNKAVRVRPVTLLNEGRY